MVALLALVGLAIVVGSLCGILAMVKISGLTERIEMLEVRLTALRPAKPSPSAPDRELPVQAPENAPPVVPKPVYVPPLMPERVRVTPDLAASEVKPPVQPEPAVPTPVVEPAIPRETVVAVRAVSETVSTRSPSEETTKGEPVFVEKPLITWPDSLPSFEEFVGTKGIWWVGMLMFLVGSAFFLKYVYDNQWIGEGGRLALGVAFSCAALGMGERFRRKQWDLPSQILTGGGVAGFYICIYFAFKIYGFIDAGLAMSLASLNTIFAVSLAVFRNALPIAVLALVGGYLSPFLFSTGENRPYALFIYVAILNSIALGSAYFRNWPLLERMALVATGLLYQGWYMKFYQADQLAPALTFASLFYAMFLVIPVVHALKTKQAGDHVKLVILAVNQLFWLYYFHAVLFDVNRNALGAIMLAQAAAVGAVLWIWSVRVGSNNPHAQVMIAIVLSLLTLVAPVLFKFRVLALTWAMEGVIFTLIGVRFRQVLSRIAGLVAFVVSGAYLAYHLPLHTTAFTPIFNAPFGSWAILVAALCGAGLILRRNEDLIDASEVHVPLIVGFVAFLATCGVLSLELHDFWRYSGSIHRNVYSYCSLGVLWACQALIATTLGARFEQPVYRGTGLALSGIAILFLAAHYPFHNVAFTPVLNVPFGAWTALVAVLVAAALISRQAELSAAPAEAYFPTAFGLLAFSVACVIASLEVKDYWMLSSVSYKITHAFSSLVVLWSLIGLGTHYALRREHFAEVAFVEWATFAIGTVICLCAMLGWNLASTMLALNTMFLARSTFIASLWIASRRKSNAGPWPVNQIYEHAGHALLALLIAVELYRWGMHTSVISHRMAISLISAAWGLQAFLLIWVGLASGNQSRRIAGFVLFAVTIAKVLLVDTSGLEKVYRIVSWLACGALLLAAGYFYQRYKPLLFGKDTGDGSGPDQHPRISH